MHRVFAKTAFFLLMSAALAAAAAQQLRIAVSDFEVTSDDPGLRYVGKGLAEMVSGELGRLKGVTVIEREKRAQILEEIEFALNEASDGKGPVPGKLSAADFALFGKVIEMGGSILVSARLVSVESGEVVWSGEKLGDLRDYGELSSGIALAVALSRGLDGAPKLAAVNRASKGTRGAILAYSAALDALDRGNAAEALRQSELASAEDAGNVDLGALFDKLAAPSPRYRNEVEFYAPIEIPAEAAFQETGSLSAWFGSSASGGIYRWGNFESGDVYYGGRLVMSVPAGKSAAIRGEAIIGNRMSFVETLDASPAAIGSTAPGVALGMTLIGAGIGLGWAVTEGLAFGAEGLCYSSGPSSYVGNEGREFASEYETRGLTGAAYGASVSMAWKNASSTLFFGAQASWMSQPSLYFSVSDPGSSGTVREGRMPLVIEAGLVGRLPGRRLFGSLRGVLEQDLDDRRGSYLAAMPGIEYWPANWVGLLAGGDLNAFWGPAPFSMGYGGLLGLCFSFGGFELSANCSLSNRHSRIIPESPRSNAPMFGFLLGLSAKGIGRRLKAR